MNGQPDELLFDWGALEDVLRFDKLPSHLKEILRVKDFRRATIFISKAPTSEASQERIDNGENMPVYRVEDEEDHQVSTYTNYVYLHPGVAEPVLLRQIQWSEPVYRKVLGLMDRLFQGARLLDTVYNAEELCRDVQQPPNKLFTVDGAIYLNGNRLYSSPGDREVSSRNAIPATAIGKHMATSEEKRSRAECLLSELRGLLSNSYTSAVFDLLSDVAAALLDREDQTPPPLSSVDATCNSNPMETPQLMGTTNFLDRLSLEKSNKENEDIGLTYEKGLAKDALTKFSYMRGNCRKKRTREDLNQTKESASVF